MVIAAVRVVRTPPMDYRWKALAVVGMGSFMGAVDATVVVIAFPQIARDLSASLVAMVWTIMVYILMGTALVLSLGRLSDLKGRKRLYLVGFLIFVLGSALCGLAGSGEALVAFRAVQGIGAAMLIANSFAVLSDAFPPSERGRAFGLNTIIWGGGAISGILLGGLILTVTSWRWIFWINVPIGLVATFLAWRTLRESVTPDPRETFDFPAAILFTAGLASLLFGATEGMIAGWTALGAVVPLLAALPLLLLFYVWERRWSRDPILPFFLFRSWLFSASLVASVLQGIALFATSFLLMAYLQGIRGISVLTAASLLAPLSIGLAAVGPIGGRLSDRYGARVLSTVGLAVQAVALFLFSTIVSGTPLYAIAGYEALLGIGGGLFFPANSSAIMGSVPRNRYGVASGVMMTVRNSATALSFVVALLALTSQLPGGLGASLLGGSFSPSTLAAIGISRDQLQVEFLDGMRVAFRASAVLVLVAAVFSALRGREVRSGPVHLVHRTGRSAALRAAVDAGDA
jgi:EmrB/QacA subfamily drug resistance transporter